jgi:hypothetical protein
MTFEWRPHARARTGRPGRPSRRARKRPKLRTQPTTAHARAVTRTTAVCIRSSSSASAGIPSSRLRKTTAAGMRRSDFACGGCLRSRRRRRGVVLPGPSPEPRRSAFGRPPRRPPGSLPIAFGRPPRPVCVAATSQVEGAFSSVVVAAERCSQGRHRKPRRSAFGRPPRRPPGSLPVAFGRLPRLVWAAATSQEQCAFGRVVVAAEWCSQGRHPNHDGLHTVVLFDVLRDPFQPPSVLSSSPRCWWHWFMSGSCSASCTRCIRSVAESEDPGVEDGGQDKGEAPYLNYRLEIRRDYRPL